MKRLAIALLLSGLIAGASKAQTPTSAAGSWQIGVMPNDPSRTCRARQNSPAIDLVIMINRDNKLVLAAGNPTWERRDGGPTDTALAVDDAQGEHLTAYLTGGMYFALIDDLLSAQLRRGKSLVWSLPIGQFKASIANFGNAMDAVRECNDRQGNGLEGPKKN